MKVEEKKEREKHGFGTRGDLYEELVKFAVIFPGERVRERDREPS